MTRLRQLATRNRLPLAAEAVVLWIAVGPWLWSFSASRSAVTNHVFLVFAVGPLAMLIAVLRPAAFVALAGAVWLMLSPWLLGYATLNAAWINELVSGSLLALLCLTAAGAHWPAIRHRRAPLKTATIVSSRWPT
ncbi:MAG: SPW repeat domain-containing protein [Solirubrobacteraceae bacterium]